MTCAPLGQNTMYDLQSLSTTTLMGIYLDLQFKRNISDVHIAQSKFTFYAAFMEVSAQLLWLTMIAFLTSIYKFCHPAS